MEQILLIIGLACLTHLWVVSEPTQALMRLLKIDYSDYDDSSKLKQTFIRFFNCHLCIGFWLGLIVLHNLPLAAIVSILSVIISNETTPKLN